MHINNKYLTEKAQKHKQNRRRRKKKKKTKVDERCELNKKSTTSVVWIKKKSSVNYQIIVKIL